MAGDTKGRGLRVLVCGGRDFADRDLLFGFLHDENLKRGFAVVIEGEARGADTLARDWAINRKLPVEMFPADWSQHGKRAGYLRNMQMLDVGKPDLVIAFAGGRGTAMMVELARQRGVEVIEVKP